jgi:hypothetical protein
MSASASVDGSEPSLSLQPLFGGAMQVALPGGLDDVSQIRQVPDNQEVFVDADTDRCVIIELLAYDATLPDSDAAVLYYFTDLAEANGAACQHDAPTVIDAAATPNIAATAAVRLFVRGTHLGVAKFKERAGNDVVVHMALLRCPTIATDLLVTQTFPVRVDAASSSAQTMQRTLDEQTAAEQFGGVLGSLQINDFGLFDA